MMEMFNPTEKLELLAASASEIHAASERTKGVHISSKLRVEFKSDEDRTRKRQLRLLKNRQSAALSRQRKKEYITDLEERTNGLLSENHELTHKIAKISTINNEFKMHIDNLEKRLSEAKNENNELRSRLSLHLLAEESEVNNHTSNHTNNNNNNNRNENNNNSRNDIQTTKIANEEDSSNNHRTSHHTSIPTSHSTIQSSSNNNNNP